jgi:hypothetical protein
VLRFKKEGLMFGQYDIPMRIDQEGITVSVQKEGKQGRNLADKNRAPSLRLLFYQSSERFRPGAGNII